ncbi:MAG: hypothetical protein FWD15_01440 [Alphaproteobacteria bacterium]|nr:hypothetical protein [Alphaproteobacteria bacterium]
MLRKDKPVAKANELARLFDEIIAFAAEYGLIKVMRMGKTGRVAKFRIAGRWTTERSGPYRKDYSADMWNVKRPLPKAMAEMIFERVEAAYLAWYKKNRVAMLLAEPVCDDLVPESYEDQKLKDQLNKRMAKQITDFAQRYRQLAYGARS